MGIGWIMAAGLLALQDPPKDLADLSLEELMRIEVTTASRKEQSLFDAPAAVGVVRGEDIRRMGVRSIPEALRMVPGTNVSRIDSNKWAVGIRGFSDRFANKLQVLIDGRSVYTPLFSGVFWDQQDVFLEDVDRIEVIRGPGGAVWGANAVNGVVNVITKKAKDTQGALVFGGGGTEERGFGGVRWGGAAGDNVHYRAYAKYFVREEQYDPVTEGDADDDWWQGRAGFRTEWAASDADTLTVIGEYYNGKSGTFNSLSAPAPQFVAPGDEDYDGSGGHAIVRWERRLGGTGLLSAQLSLARTVFETSFFSEDRDTMDFDLTHRWSPLDGHDVVWGAGYRATRDNLTNSFSVNLDPEEETDDVVSVFAQDEIAISGDVLKLTLGARAEHNDYTGFELQPSGRLAIRPNDRHMAWLAVSRAVRTPSRGENDILIIGAVLPPPPPPPPGLTDTQVQVRGNRHVRSEDLIAYEAGYRVRPDDSLTLDLALFYNDYENLISNEPRGFSVVGTSAVILSEFDNDYEGRTYGAEVAATWQVAKGVRVYGAYTALKMNLDPHGDSADTGTEASERRDAKGQAFARISLDVVESVAVDFMGRYVGPLGARDVDAYSEMDIRVAWRALPSLELSIVGQNLLHDEHLESSNSGLTERATETERGAYLMGVWTF